MAASEYDDYGPVAPSPTRTAIDILRARFPQFLRDNEDATLSYDPTGSLAVKDLRDARLGELSDRLVNDEASAAIPHEGYVPGEPGRRSRSNAPDVFNLLRTRGQLRNLSGEAAADPYTGQAEQDRVGGVRDALTTASLTTQPALDRAAHAVAERNAFGDFLKKQAGYKAETSPEGVAALEAASKRKVKEETAGRPIGALKQIPDPEHPGRTIWVRSEDAIGSAAPMPAAERTRVTTAKTVQDTGNDIITQLADPNVAKQLGPLMGRYNTLQEFIGDPPPELAELAAQIDSFAYANMGVHGMRSAEGAKRLSELMTRKHTPESLAASVRGLSQFSQHFIENAVGGGGGAAGGGTVQMRAPDGSIQPVPAGQVEHYKKLGATVVP